MVNCCDPTICSKEATFPVSVFQIHLLAKTEKPELNALVTGGPRLAPPVQIGQFLAYYVL
jgi:hypothetical protein